MCGLTGLRGAVLAALAALNPRAGALWGLQWGLSGFAVPFVEQRCRDGCAGGEGFCGRVVSAEQRMLALNRNSQHFRTVLLMQSRAGGLALTSSPWSALMGTGVRIGHWRGGFMGRPLR